MRPPRLIPPLWFLLAMLAMAGLHLWLPGPRLLAWPITLVGVLVMACGVGLLVWAAGLFFGAGTPVRPFQPSTVLVERGPFRITRNPMYLGLVTALAGIALALGTASPWIAVPVFWWWIDRAFVRNEEPLLRATFGQAYDDYSARVRRWFGRRRTLR